MQTRLKKVKHGKYVVEKIERPARPRAIGRIKEVAPIVDIAEDNDDIAEDNDDIAKDKDNVSVKIKRGKRK